ncbi:MAG: hypothetical protein ACE5R6_03925 [Candidatus Heimdallarchaeota archaeon]
MVPGTDEMAGTRGTLFLEVTPSGINPPESIEWINPGFSAIQVF